MVTPFIGLVIPFASNFAPRGWALCDGQLLAIAQNTALFSILGTTYGGDGRTTFGLPDLRGRIAVEEGNGPGLTPIDLGERGGREQVVLATGNLPAGVPVYIPSTSGDATTEEPENAVTAVTEELTYAPPTTGTAKRNMAPGTVAGSSRAFEIVEPFVCVNYIIALFGTYPSRS